jgi:RimJ/RimL family protein N-acetyltransferase
MRFVGARTDEEFIRWRFDKLTGQYETGTGHLAVVEREGDRLVGAAGLLRHDDWTATPDNIEVGWLVRKDAWGRGYAVEAGGAALAYAFADLGIDTVICIVDPRNRSSRRVAEKLGMRLAGETIWRDHDVVWYHLDRS